MLTTDRVAGTALICFSLLVIWESRHLPFGTFRQPGPAYIPVILATLLLLFGLSLTFISRRAPSLFSIRWTEWRHAAAILAAAVFSGFSIERLGYRLTILLVLFFLLKLVEKRSWLLSLVFAFTLSFGSFFLFYTVLRVPLPQGPLGF
jgi:Tripartite tricarboxylate transporter TctB family